MFELVRGLGLYNSLAGLVLSYLILTLPFTTWVLTAFMRELPVELEEAAIVDGASPWRILFGIFLPLLAPALAATGLLSFILRSEEHTSELQSLMRISYAVFCLPKITIPRDTLLTTY